MKRVLSVILAILILCLALPAEAEPEEDAEALRSSLESRYD